MLGMDGVLVKGFFISPLASPEKRVREQESPKHELWKRKKERIGLVFVSS
jgi:hypothetical protein